MDAVPAGGGQGLDASQEALHRRGEVRAPGKSLWVGDQDEQSRTPVVGFMAAAGAGAGKSSGEGLDDQGEQKALVTRGITPEGPQGASSRGVQQTGRIGRRPPTLVNQPPLRSPVALVRGHRHAPEGSHTGGHVDHQGRLPGRARDSGGNRVRAQKGSGRSEGSHTGAAAPGVRHEQGDEPVPSRALDIAAKPAHVIAVTHRGAPDARAPRSGRRLFYGERRRNRPEAAAGVHEHRGRGLSNDDRRDRWPDRARADVVHEDWNPHQSVGWISRTAGPDQGLGEHRALKPGASQSAKDVPDQRTDGRFGDGHSAGLDHRCPVPMIPGQGPNVPCCCGHLKVTRTPVPDGRRNACAPIL